MLVKIKNDLIVTLTLALLILVLAGCAPNDYQRGRGLLEKRKYSDALRLLAAAEKEFPENFKIKRDMGIALLKMRKVDLAISRLEQAKSLNPRDGKTIFYLGLAYETGKMTTKAIEEYQRYESLGDGSGDFSKSISKRIKQLNRKKMAREISIALANEQRLDASRFSQNTIAVLNFENFGGLPELDPLRKGLAELLITDLAKVEELNVVERLKLQTLLDEIELGATGVVDQQTTPRVGRLLGARKLIKGGFTHLENVNLRIDTYLTETDSRKLHELDQISGKMTGLFRMEKELALTIIGDLGIELSKEEREAILKIPTESLLAFLAYSKGLDYEDRGIFDKAKVEFAKAVSIDPGFELAQESLANVEINQSAATEAMISTAQLEQVFESTSETEPPEQNRGSRLLVTGAAAQTGQVPEGDNDSREPVAEGSGADRVGGDVVFPAEIEITIPLPDNND